MVVEYVLEMPVLVERSHNVQTHMIGVRIRRVIATFSWNIIGGTLGHHLTY